MLFTKFLILSHNDLSLFELAACKGNFFWFDGSQNFHTMQEVVELWAMDESSDPVTY
jgi:hypothetical protein